MLVPPRDLQELQLPARWMRRCSIVGLGLGGLNLGTGETDLDTSC